LRGNDRAPLCLEPQIAMFGEIEHRPPG
jgi:hypothetical protein